MIDTGILLIRVVVGLYVAGHGAQKLFGWFGGLGLDATVDMMGGATGLRPARLWVPFVSATEVVGGLLMAIGFLGPLGPIAVAGAMLGATMSDTGRTGHGSQTEATNLRLLIFPLHSPSP